jgi:hypothetical protein
MLRRTLAKPLVTGTFFAVLATLSFVVAGPLGGVGFGLIALAWYAQDFLNWRRSRAAG